VFQHNSSAADGDDAAASSDGEDHQQQQQQRADNAGNITYTAAAGADDRDMQDATAAAADAPFELTDLDCEVRLLHGQQQQHAVQVDAVALTRAFCKQCCWRVLATNEVGTLFASCPCVLFALLVVCIPSCLLRPSGLFPSVHCAKESSSSSSSCSSVLLGEAAL
jgi:hypothetical protein